ncbi:S1C family serine protease [Streptomyces spirodelae]|uniref:Serine protease n=1 Tax=Streptomyces spirodelae TaxID=2812904 RepID=A0ABS3X2V9_9ACTN|nr:S1C family serine protease [Streptomyces spirodelae]MBO8189661.1 serine protease [Streptomyces spirodelae]
MSTVCGRPTLVRIRDLAGRPRGLGFVADGLGTVVTSHEAVDGLGRVVLHAGDGTRSTLVAADRDITPVPRWNLALIRTPGLHHLDPLVIGGERTRPGTPAVLLTEDEALHATLIGTVPATYTSTARYHAMERVLQVELPEADGVPLRLSRRASGAPVVDAATGAVLGVLGTALHATSGRRGTFAVPLRAAGMAAPDGPLGVLLRRNGAVVPGFGPDLNLAGVLRLTAACVGPAVERCAHAVTRPEVAEAFEMFAHSGASVLALVGAPGTGRTTELAAAIARRARAAAPAPSVWLRGADLRPDDTDLGEAVGRALAGVAPCPGDAHSADPDLVARLASAAGRPLLVLLDAPEEMPLQLAHTLPQWTASTASWLRASGARLAVACRPEHWEQAAALFPADMLYALAGTDGSVRVGGLPRRQATRAQTAYGLPDGLLAPRDAGHPLAMRMLSQVRAAQGALCGRRPPGGSEADPADREGERAPARHEIFSAFLDLLCLRIARRLTSCTEGEGSEGEGSDGSESEAPDGEGSESEAPGDEGSEGEDSGAVRRLAARVAGRLHEAARRCLGSGQGDLSRAAFDELFPRRGGWASAVLAEGVLAPAGEGYRFVDEEFSDWLQGCHLDLDGALDALVGNRSQGDATEAPPVPHHRISPVVQALLLCDRRDGAVALTPRLRRLADSLVDPLAEAADKADVAQGQPTGEAGQVPGEAPGEVVWWAVHLLAGTLPLLPDASPYTQVLACLARRVAERQESATVREHFGPRFWHGLPLTVADKAGLLRHLLPADPPADRPCEQGRSLDLLGELLVAEPVAVQRLLCEWFSDQRPLRRRTDVESRTVPTVATAAQALLYTHRNRAADDLADALVDAAHPCADELLAELVHDELSVMCRAVERWAHDSRDSRDSRWTAAARYGVQAARLARSGTDRKPLRSAALALLHRSAGTDLRTAALTMLVRDPHPHGRTRHMAAALCRFSDTGDAELAASLGTALTTHPEPVLAAFRSLLTEPGDPAAQSEAVRALARVRTPALARRAAALVRAYAELRPWRAREDVAAFVGHRLRHGPGAREVLLPLVTELLREQEPPLRAELARVLGMGEGPLRDELLDLLLAQERDVSVLEAALEAVSRRATAPRPRRLPTNGTGPPSGNGHRAEAWADKKADKRADRRGDQRADQKAGKRADERPDQKACKKADQRAGGTLVRHIGTEGRYGAESGLLRPGARGSHP